MHQAGIQLASSQYHASEQASSGALEYGHGC